MNLILTMAGRYKSFADEGYKAPKYLLPWGDRTVLWTLLSELRRGNAFANVWLVANHRDEAFMPHVRAIMRDQGIEASNLLLVGDTRGQAETAWIGLEAAKTVAPNESVVFHNVDTLLYQRDYGRVEAALQKADGYIDVFGSGNRDYSYVLVENGRVTEIAEKIVVSNLATSGFYGFANPAVFEKHFQPEKDIYVSSLYKKIIAEGGVVVAGERHKESDTVVLSTPNEYIGASLLHFH